MNVLVACERFGAVRDAFRAMGHSAWSCDLDEDASEAPGTRYHLRMDAIDAINIGGWDLMIAFPPCTYLCSSGLHWNTRRPDRAIKTVEALAFVRSLMAADIPQIAIENPRGCIGTQIRRADQVIQPYQFGADASKETHLWLKGLAPLAHGVTVAGRQVTRADGRTVARWANQTDSGQNKLGPSTMRAAERGRTYQGIATAMAEQWGTK